MTVRGSDAQRQVVTVSSSILQQGNHAFLCNCRQMTFFLLHKNRKQKRKEGTEKAHGQQWGKQGKQGILMDVTGGGLLQEMAKNIRFWHQAEFSLPGKCVKTSADILSWTLQRDTEPKDSNSFLWQPKVQKHKHFHCHWQVPFT